MSISELTPAPLSILVEQKEEDDKTESRVMHDRSHLLDAAIVRIMKARKHMGWNELTNAVVDAVYVSCALDHEPLLTIPLERLLCRPPDATNSRLNPRPSRSRSRV